MNRGRAAFGVLAAGAALAASPPPLWSALALRATVQMGPPNEILGTT